MTKDLCLIIEEANGTKIKPASTQEFIEQVAKTLRSNLEKPAQ